MFFGLIIGNGGAALSFIYGAYVTYVSKDKNGGAKIFAKTRYMIALGFLSLAFLKILYPNHRH